MTRYLYIDHPFPLESGAVLPTLTAAYHTYGTLNEAKDNVIWVCHALTANSDAADWWPGLVGPGFTLDPAKYFIVCVNMLGSCYGSTSCRSLDPATGKAYGLDFPLVTTRDNARFFALVADYLGIGRIRLLMGGSMGGQHASEWACLQPERIELLCLLATNARHSAWGIAFNESQRMALRADTTFATDSPEAGRAGLEAARSLAILSYRHYRTYQATQTEPDPAKTEDFRASSYQRYQGYKLWKRFDPLCYYHLSRGMDSHHLGRGRTGEAAALGRILAQTLIISIDTDILFPTEEQSFLSRHIPNSRLEVMQSDYGHDGFLVETPTIGRLLADFLQDQLTIDAATKHAFTDSLSGRTFAIPGTEEV
ncbi:homoserine O-acetyltransferase [Neolewinella lacunae]|uniref:Homoserine O-acetyltransferase n=1 Tax=Neolewinella lacunae TaxID=1517758 RepID=A0A923PLN0_9BACT|nr:homoserine O-acetyltransferase [Neolewinella lacunae]MBC6992782.1 homoserine O-acetyltransferase [Neolewinella lacunae]MDN3636026.1 homoserine O-acetyltransferase [Neolewinella lacunae]